MLGVFPKADLRLSLFDPRLVLTFDPERKIETLAQLMSIA